MNMEAHKTRAESADGVSNRSRLAFKPVAAIRALTLSGAVYLFFAVFYFLFGGAVDDSLRLALLHIGSAISFFTYWKFGRWGSARFDSFGAALLLLSALLRILAAIDAITYGTRIDLLPHTVQYPESIMGLLFKGEVITHFGVLLVVTSWRVMVSARIEHFSFLHNYRTVNKKLPLMMYALAIAVEVGRRTLSADFGVLGQISSLTYSFGVVSIFFIAIRQTKPFKRIWLALGLASPMVILAMGIGMKENIFFPLVPAALLYWFGYRGLSPKVVAIASGTLLLALSQLYVGYIRETAWGSDREYSTAELVSGFQAHMAGADRTRGLESISSRINMTTSHAITVAIADSRGFEPFEIFGSIPASLIPRFLWHNKPVLQPGAMHTARIHNLNVPLSEISTATAAGFFTELYLGGGYIGYIFGALAFGMLLAALQLWAFKNSPGFGHLAFCFVSAYLALRFDEKAVAYAYTSVVFTSAFVFMLSKMSIFFRMKQRFRTASN